MKKSFWLLIVGFALFQSCEESLPPIDFSAETLVLKDTVYITSSLPNPQPLNVVIEDFTGVKCTNCPEASQKAKDIQADLGNRVFIKALYPTSPRNLVTQDPGYDDLTRDLSQLIGTNIYDFSNQLPAGGVSRTIYSGQTKVNTPTSSWETGVKELLAKDSKINLDAQSIRITDSTIALEVKAVFQELMSEDVFISISILEDNLKQPQYSASGKIEDYKHSHVLREMFTPYNGSLLISKDDISIGTTVEKGWSLTLPDYIIQENSKLWIELNYSSPSSAEIIQCQELDLN